MATPWSQPGPMDVRCRATFTADGDGPHRLVGRRGLVREFAMIRRRVIVTVVVAVVAAVWVADRPAVVRDDPPAGPVGVASASPAGRRPVLEVLEQIRVVDEHRAGYDRDLFDYPIDGDGPSTRSPTTGSSPTSAH